MGTWDSVRLLCAQFISFPYPTTKFTGKSIIVTGSNVGLGLEAARHFVRLNAGKVILAVRNASKGEDAARSITESTGRHDVVEVWELDLACRDSVKAFARRAQGLERLDVVVENAAINLTEFQMEEDNESTITVNVINTLLLALLLLPMLRKSSVKYKADTVLTFTGSFVHYLTQFPERKSPNIFKELANPKTARMNDRLVVKSYQRIGLPCFRNGIPGRDT
jgi:retinol dehydrogenase-12